MSSSKADAHSSSRCSGLEPMPISNHDAVRVSGDEVALAEGLVAQGAEDARLLPGGRASGAAP
jgi:hypothetical protein